MNARDKARELAKVLLHYADGGEVECQDKCSGTKWFVLGNAPVWNFSVVDYRIKDPYTRLKAAAKDPTKQIRYLLSGWVDAVACKRFDGVPEDYEIRDKPKPKKVKLLAWFTGAALFWRTDDTEAPDSWIRVPGEDREIEVTE